MFNLYTKFLHPPSLRKQPQRSTLNAIQKKSSTRRIPSFLQKYPNPRSLLPQKNPFQITLPILYPRRILLCSELSLSSALVSSLPLSLSLSLPPRLLSLYTALHCDTERASASRKRGFGQLGEYRESAAADAAHVLPRGLAATA